jgi:hypothetical protein
MKKIVLIIACLLLVAPDVISQRKKRPKPKPNPYDAIVDAATAPGDAALEKRIRDLEHRVFELETNARKNSTVELNVAQLGNYQRLNSESGTFLVTLSNVEKYLDGYKIQLAIGNVTTAIFKNFNLTLRWGIKEPETNWVEWYKSVRTKSQNYPQSLKPGQWNTVEIILLPARQEELGYLELAIETDTVELFKPNGD